MSKSVLYRSYLIAAISLQSLVFQFSLYAQQDALYSQYMFNLFALNPGYAGSRQSVSAVLVHRSQWIGMDGAPATQSFSVHAPMTSRRIAFGFNAANEQLGPTRNISLAGTYAYHLHLGNGKLSMALRSGIYRLQLDGEQLTYKDKTDQNNQGLLSSRYVPTFDFGTYYFTHKVYAGMAVTHISQQKIHYYGIENLQAKLYRHFLLMSGVAFPLRADLVFKPSVILRYAYGAPLNMDINMSCLLKKIVWLGASYRTAGDLVLIAEFNITDYLRAGYAFDLGLNELKKYQNGSHEFFVGVDFAIKKTVIISPRYL